MNFIIKPNYSLNKLLLKDKGIYFALLNAYKQRQFNLKLNVLDKFKIKNFFNNNLNFNYKNKFFFNLKYKKNYNNLLKKSLKLKIFFPIKNNLAYLYYYYLSCYSRFVLIDNLTKSNRLKNKNSFKFFLDYNLKRYVYNYNSPLTLNLKFTYFKHFQFLFNLPKLFLKFFFNVFNFKLNFSLFKKIFYNENKKKQKLILFSLSNKNLYIFKMHKLLNFILKVKKKVFFYKKIFLKILILNILKKNINFKIFVTYFNFIKKNLNNRLKFIIKFNAKKTIKNEVNRNSIKYFKYSENLLYPKNYNALLHIPRYLNYSKRIINFLKYKKKFKKFFRRSFSSHTLSRYTYKNPTITDFKSLRSIYYIKNFQETPRLKASSFFFVKKYKPFFKNFDNYFIKKNIGAKIKNYTKKQKYINYFCFNKDNLRLNVGNFKSFLNRNIQIKYIFKSLILRSLIKIKQIKILLNTNLLNLNIKNINFFFHRLFLIFFNFLLKRIALFFKSSNNIFFIKKIGTRLSNKFIQFSLLYLKKKPRFFNQLRFMKKLRFIFKSGNIPFNNFSKNFKLKNIFYLYSLFSNLKLENRFRWILNVNLSRFNLINRLKFNLKKKLTFRVKNLILNVKKRNIFLNFNNIKGDTLFNKSGASLGYKKKVLRKNLNPRLLSLKKFFEKKLKLKYKNNKLFYFNLIIRCFRKNIRLKSFFNNFIYKNRISNILKTVSYYKNFFFNKLLNRLSYNNNFVSITNSNLISPFSLLKNFIIRMYSKSFVLRHSFDFFNKTSKIKINEQKKIIYNIILKLINSPIIKYRVYKVFKKFFNNFSFKNLNIILSYLIAQNTFFSFLLLWNDTSLILINILKSYSFLTLPYFLKNILTRLLKINFKFKKRFKFNYFYKKKRRLKLYLKSLEYFYYKYYNVAYKKNSKTFFSKLLNSYQKENKNKLTNKVLKNKFFNILTNNNYIISNISWDVCRTHSKPSKTKKIRRL